MTDIEGLIERLEKAEKGSLALEVEVFEAFESLGPFIRIGGVTTSIDVALTLVPKSCPVDIELERKWGATCKIYLKAFREVFGIAKTAPLAICAAALRAREVEREK